jgi:hypothetical protein
LNQGYAEPAARCFNVVVGRPRVDWRRRNTNPVDGVVSLVILARCSESPNVPCGRLISELRIVAVTVYVPLGRPGGNDTAVSPAVPAFAPVPSNALPTALDNSLNVQTTASLASSSDTTRNLSAVSH